MSHTEPSSVAANRAHNNHCEMERLFSRESRYTIWRNLWFWLAQSQKELDIIYLVPIPDSYPPAFMERRIDDEDLEQLRRCCNVSRYHVNTMQMRSLTPDHVLDLRAQFHFVTDIDAPQSEHWLNIGVTHEYTLENTEQILMTHALDILITKLSMLLYRLRNFAMDHKSVHCLIYESDYDRPTYVTTIGEKVASWAKTLGEILWCFQKLRCNIGSAGSQPITQCEQGNIAFLDKLSMLEHFEGDESKCERLDGLLRKKMGFEKCHAKDYFRYRSDTNRRLGRICHTLGDTALQVVEDLDHFDSGGQLVEKRPKSDGSPITEEDPKFKQSPLLRISADALMQVAITFKDPRMSKTHGEDEYIMARLFKHAARVVRVLQSIIEGLYYNSQNANTIKWLEMPFMMSGPLISRLTLRREDPMTIMRHLRNIGLSVVNEPLERQTYSFLDRLMHHGFFNTHAVDIRNAVLSVQDVTHSERLVDEICGEHGIIDRRLQPYWGYIREMTAGESQAPLMIESAKGN
ncbi:Adenylosuccinate lyase [Fusarium oxysporum f. sp. cubense]|uniref:Adenylosuccinate lyase n=1 Tax=Fusarium oxysporum f. sp. cubense TaxID=61366 RepID=A0A559LFH6_FUSOC|nr:Adenylosuccinate lyase [Fusarium oxysporum f. sp. cubense]